MKRPISRFRLILPVGLLVLAAGTAGIVGTFLVSPGCSFVESTTGALADVTEGTAVSGVFRGAQKAAESYRDYEPSQEYYIGRAVGAEILSRYKVHPDAKLQEYVNLVGLAVLAAPEAKTTFAGYHFVVLEGDEVQAVSAPGGFVFLTEGTVRKARDEDELAAVLAHEIAHISLNHGINAIKAATRQQSAALLVQGVGEVAAEAAGGDGATKELVELTAVFADAVQEVTTELLVKGYSRELEVEADAQATIYLKSSGYTVGALVDYLRVLESTGEGGEGGWRATHPPPSDRIAALTEAGISLASTPGRKVRKARFAAVLAA